MRGRACPVTVALVLWAASVRGGIPLGPEFVVNTYTTNVQRLPALGVAPDGSFVAVWASYRQDGSDYGVFGRRYDASGTAVGATDFRVNVHTAEDQFLAAVAASPDQFVVVWTSWDQDGSYHGIFGRRFNSVTGAAGEEFLVTTTTQGNQRFPAIASDAAGNFVVVWVSHTHDHYFGGGIYAQRYSADGAPRGREFLVNTFTTNSQGRPSVAMNGDGHFAGGDGHGDGVRGQRFSPDTDELFGDDFETGNLASWSASNTDGADLSTSVFAAMDSSSIGLQGVIDDTVGLYVQDDTPEDEDRYRARFHFDPNGFDPGEALAHRRIRVFIAFSEAPTRRVAAIVLRRLGGAYALMVRARLDDDTQADTAFVPITNGPHVVEIDLRRGSGPDALDGGLDVWIDGVLAGQLSALDNNLGGVDFARMGALSVKTGAGGTLYFDEFVSRRGTYIGP